MDISRTVYTVYTSLTVLNARLLERATSQRRVIRLSPTKVVAVPLDSQQSLFFFKFSGGSARERERRTAKLREARLSHHTPSVTRVVISVSYACRSTEKRDCSLSTVAYERFSNIRF